MTGTTQIRLSLVGAAMADDHVFGVEGGTFGRSRKCDWVLHDEERILSSVHGRVLFENGAFVLVDESTNGIFVGGTPEPVGRGNAVALIHGMRFAAGPYEVAVEAPQAAAPVPYRHGSDPAGRPARGAEAALRADDEFGSLWGGGSQDPLDYLDPPPAGGGNLLGNPVPLSGWPAPPPQPPAQPPEPRAPLHTEVPRHAAVPAGPGNGAIPQVPPAPAPAGGPIPEDFLAALGPLGPVSPEPAPAVNAATPPPMPVRIPEDFDPVTALNAAAPRQPAPAAPATEPAPPAAPRPLNPELMADLVEIGTADEERPAAGQADGPVSENLAALRARRAQRKTTLREKTAAAGAALPVPPMPPMRHEAPPLPPAPPDAGPAGVMPGAEAAAPDRAPLRALIEGMGFPEVEIAATQRERLLREVGETMRETAAGLIALLAARRAVKTEFRMDETQVQPEENNPFKFFNVAELALDELFLTRSGGFQPAPEATRQAFEDIQQHSMMTMSAMQRAVTLLFERLSPEAVARHEGGDGGPRIRGTGARRDKWTAYVEHHAKMSGNIDTIARQIVADAFAQVQEEQARRNAEDYWENAR